LYVVTGGAGFIGSNIVAGLEANQAGPVVVVDRLGTDDKWRNIAKRELEDVVAPEDLFPFLNGRAGKIEAVIHMGAISSTVETNVDSLIRENFHLSLWLAMVLGKWCAADLCVLSGNLWRWRTRLS
jgi:ADP-L-glycero-D-manno-heptose 6-epimerase